LEKIAINTKCIISTIGPFVRYGSPLVAVCAQTGTHYCDITGEVDWVKDMIVKYDELAKKNGASIVNCCGCDCVPWDLLTQASYKYIQDKDSTEKLTTIKYFDEMKGEPSGGTLESILEIVSDVSAMLKTSELGFDPLLKKYGSKEKSSSSTSNGLQMILNYSFTHSAWVGFMPLA